MVSRENPEIRKVRGKIAAVPREKNSAKCSANVPTVVRTPLYARMYVRMCIRARQQHFTYLFRPFSRGVVQHQRSNIYKRLSPNVRKHEDSSRSVNRGEIEIASRAIEVPATSNTVADASLARILVVACTPREKKKEIKEEANLRSSRRGKRKRGENGAEENSDSVAFSRSSCDLFV